MGLRWLALLWLFAAAAHELQAPTEQHPAGFVEIRRGQPARVLCRHCGQEISTRGHHVKFHQDESNSTHTRCSLDPGGALSGPPPRFNFSNPEGHDFQVALFSNTSGVKLHGQSSKEASFFPPYSWQILSCSRCSHHLGWRFSRPRGRCPPKAAAAAGPRSALEEKKKLVQDIERTLGGKCMVINTGWWTFQYCHRKEIRQYHREEDGRRGNDWSLGRFEERARNGSHIFVNGQRCDETSAGRHSEVRFERCERHRERSPAAEQAVLDGERAYVHSIQEPGLCAYVFTICLLPEEHEEEQECGQESNGALSRFDALIWPNVVPEDAEELGFVHNMKLRI